MRYVHSTKKQDSKIERNKKMKNTSNLYQQMDALKASYESELNHYRVKADLRKWRLNRREVCDGATESKDMRSFCFFFVVIIYNKLITTYREDRPM